MDPQSISSLPPLWRPLATTTLDAIIAEMAIDPLKMFKKDAGSRRLQMPPQRSPDQSKPDQLDHPTNGQPPKAIGSDCRSRECVEGMDLSDHGCREQRSGCDGDLCRPT